MSDTADNAKRSKLFPTLLGERFDTLAPTVKLAHGGHSVRLLGRSNITRGSGLLSRFCAFFAHLPPAQTDVEIEVAIHVANDGSESWKRRFGSALMPAVLSIAPNGLLRERLGAVRFDFRLTPDANGFRWYVERFAAFGIPLPARWFRGVHAYSYSDAKNYRFLVHAELPIAGLLVRYEGWLTPADLSALKS